MEKIFSVAGHKSAICHDILFNKNEKKTSSLRNCVVYDLLETTLFNLPVYKQQDI